MFNCKILPAVVICFSWFFPNPAASDIANDEYYVHCHKGVFQLCGYDDSKTESELIAPEFEQAFMFSEGLAGVRVGGLFGYIDSTGKMIVKPQFQLVGSFNQGLAEVIVDDLAGVIDRAGKFVLEPQFSRAIPLSSEVVIAIESRWIDFRTPLDEMWHGLGDKILSVRAVGPIKEPAGLYHLSKGWITDPMFAFYPFDNPSRELIWAGVNSDEDVHFGLMRFDGTWQVAPKYSEVSSLRNGRAGVSVDQIRETGARAGEMQTRAGIVDKDGTLILPLQFDYAESFTEIFYIVGNDQKQGLVDHSGFLLGGRYFDSIAALDGTDLEAEEEGPFRVLHGETWFGLTQDGALVPDPREGMVLASCPGGLTARRRLGWFIEFSHPGLDAPITPLFSWWDGLPKGSCGEPARVGGDGMYGFIMPDGTVLGGKLSYEDARSFWDGLAAVQQAGKWGLIDMNGRFVVAPIYDDMVRKKDFYRARLGDLDQGFDKNGAPVELPVIPEPAPSRYLDCAAGAQLFENEELWGVADADGKVLIDANYQVLTCYSEGIAWGVVQGGTAWCPIGKNGQRHVDLACRETYSPFVMDLAYPGDEAFNPN